MASFSLPLVQVSPGWISFLFQFVEFSEQLSLFLLEKKGSTPKIRNFNDYKFSSQCFSVINGTRPEYLSELLTTYIPSWQFRSASDTIYNEVLFPFQAATVSNELPQTVRYSTPIPSVKSSLKKKSTCSVSKRKTSHIFVYSRIRPTLLELFLFSLSHFLWQLSELFFFLLSDCVI